MKKYFILLIGAILTHVIIGYLMLPKIMQDQIDTYGMSEISVKIGWALGKLAMFGVGIPLIISLVSLIRKEFRCSSSDPI